MKFFGAIRKSIVVKTSMAMIGLVLLVLAVLYLSLARLLGSLIGSGFSENFSSAGGSQVLHYAQWLFVLAGVGAVLFASGLAVVLSHRMVKPLLRMEQATMAMQRGNYETKIVVPGDDEMSRLGAAINSLAQNLNRLETTRRQFLADVAHELRTPLSYIRGYSQVLAEGLDSTPGERTQYLKIILDESIRIERLIEDLFSLAQADEGTLRISKTSEDLSQVIQGIIGHMRPSAEAKGVGLLFEGEWTKPVLLDRQRIEQVLFNLIDNALRYSPNGGQVGIRIVPAGTDVKVEITDNGPGIPNSELPFVWERFYRVEKSRSRQFGGTGLGLAIVKQIVQLHGGCVALDSRPDQGTTVSFVLPAEEASP
ncbi:HAMP domain-containing histidine kinase [Alicyclobacillus tolerans]|uniref:sensor histidine kinase n=1 Tax=Alicyclobacillus tolerans TaxID=90970 RepID=UPI001F42BF6A|nr:HAMP domain-containing sensor histidine kinase [Alicyclobacillus tolerans]MCF8568180.1 HAMP domain-containing histidine kinase [Alicyclobacillus tolerans]